MSTSSFHVTADGFTKCWIDGSCKDNGREGARAGYGVYWGEKHPKNESCTLSHLVPATNSVAELKAAIHAINRAKSFGIRKLEINTDSQVVVDGATKWYKVWLQNGWRSDYDGGQIKNIPEWKELLGAMQGIDCKFTKVPAHAGVLGNERADRLAKLGADNCGK